MDLQSLEPNSLLHHRVLFKIGWERGGGRLRKEVVMRVIRHSFSSFVLHDRRHVSPFARGDHFLLLSLCLRLKCLVIYRKCGKWELQTRASNIQANYVLSYGWQRYCQGTTKEAELGCLALSLICIVIFNAFFFMTEKNTCLISFVKADRPTRGQWKTGRTIL